MTSEIRNRESSLWSRDSANSWGGTFDLKWLQVHDLPFEKTLHLRNRLNANKPVKICRDGQAFVVVFLI